MAVFKRTTIPNNGWTVAATWTLVSGTGTYPDTIDDQAIWDSSTISTGTVVSTSSVGQLVVQNPPGTVSILVNATQAITIDPSGGSFGGVGIDMSTATQNFSINSYLVLGSSQTWRVASSRTLTASQVITGNAKNLTLEGPGTVTLSGNSTATWINSTIFATGNVLLNANNVGAASNAINVAAGSTVNLNTTTPAQITLSGEGDGTSGRFFAVYVGTANQPASRTFTFAGSRTAFSSSTSVTATTHASKFTGTTTSETVFYLSGNTTLTNTANDFVAGGNGVEIQNRVGSGAADGRYALILSGDISDTAVFGAASNRVYIEESGSFQTQSATTTRTISRNFKIEGHSTGAAPDIFNNTTQRLVFTGEMNLLGTGGFASTFDSATGVIALAGTLTGAGNLKVLAGGTVEIASGFTQSAYTGTLINEATVRYALGTFTAPYQAVNSTMQNVSAGPLTLSHSSYSIPAGTLTTTGAQSLSLGSGAVSSTGALGFAPADGTLIVPGNISLVGVLTKSGAGPLQLEGNVTGATGFVWTAGSLILNSAGSAGTTATTFTATSTGTLDSTTGAVLTQNGAVALNANFTWKGTANLTFGAGNVTTTIDRTIIFAGTGETGTLKFSGAITTSLNTTSWNIGGSTSNAKQRVTLVGANASQADTTVANQHAITAGYFRIENNNGLGAAGTTTAWWVGATNLGSVTPKAALELAGVTTPDVKSVNLYGQGPNDDGALIGVSGTSIFRGGISIPNVAGTRIGVKGGATLTLASGFYTSINAANAGTPLTFVAESGSTLNVDRVLGGPVLSGSNIGAVNVANGTGTVVLSRANLHTGAMTCSAGTTKLTHANAVGAGAGNNVTVTAGAAIEANGVKEVFPATLTLGNSPTTPAIFKISA
jgi:autotransporter-associated beta strand protein